MSEDPYTGYGSQPQDFHPYGTSQNTYNATLGSNTTPSPYSYGQQDGYGQQQQSYEYTSPQAAPLPLEQAIKELPNQYIKVLTKPSAETFAQEMGKASWNIVWIQLIGYALISAILSYITSLIMPNPFAIFETGTNPIVVLLIYWAFTLGLVPLITASFFVGNGILYLIAKAFRGRGTFLAQGYTNLLLAVPLGILSTLASRIPLLGTLVTLGILVYTMVLHIFSIMAVHHLSGRKATAVVLLPIVLGIVVIVLLVALIVGLIIAAGIIR